MTEKISEIEIKKYLTDTEREIIVLPTTDSTNNYAKELAKSGAKAGTAVIARTQTMGRGRMGRNFFSPEGMGLYMSVILKPMIAAEDNMLITALSAVAAARAIEKVCGADVKIKWVNDLFLGGRKVCGILAETVTDFGGQTPEYIVLGMGINVKKTDFPPELSEVATSLENETGESISKNELAAEILKELDRLYTDFPAEEFLEESRRRSMVIGREITVIRGDEKYDARAVGIDGKGGLIISHGGETSVLSSGEISIRVVKDEN